MVNGFTCGLVGYLLRAGCGGEPLIVYDIGINLVCGQNNQLFILTNRNPGCIFIVSTGIDNRSLTTVSKN